MARKWATFDDWSGGGFFNNGAFRSPGRFRSLNMQTYANGSIGPRPQLRKMSQIADAGSSIPSTTSYTRMKWGGGWSSAAPSGWSYGAVLLVSDPDDAGNCRAIRLYNDGTAEYFTTQELGTTVGGDDLLPSNEATGIHAVKPVVDGSLPVYFGSLTYDPVADAVADATPHVIGATDFIHTKLVLYKNRMYGWGPSAAADREYVVYSRDDDLSDFSGTDNAGNFRLSVAPGSFEPALPRGMWALGSGLLVFTSEGTVGRTSGYESVGDFYADFGRWYMITGPNIDAGTLTPLGYDSGPQFHSLAVIHDGNLLFPIAGEGWAVHDGNKLDKSSLGNLKPRQVDDEGRRISWLHPFSVRNEPSLFLPFIQSGNDPTSVAQTGAEPRYGEFYASGYGGLEFVNGVWTEHLYLHGHGNLAHFESFDQNKVYMIHLDSEDDGATFYPQIWTRDITLNRPSTTTDLEARNPFSNGVEEDYVYDSFGNGSGLGERYMVCYLETAEWHATDYGSVTPETLIIDYDYWNSEYFNDDCGFDVEITYRDQRNNGKQTIQINTTRITPPETSETIFPKRGREILNIPRMSCGTFQIRAINIKDVAIQAFAVGYEDGVETYT
jgi:hypothetical protein